METRANYILIGLFTILGLLGIVGLFLWFARVELDRQFSYYDIRFTSVAGLSEASDVRFAGLPVGQVVFVRLSPDRDGTVQVRVEVDADTPVREDSIATIEAQGVTGVSYVLIGPGSPDAPLLEATADTLFPEIEAGRSVFQSLSEEAPRLISETIAAVEEVNILLGGDNRARFQNILINAEMASETLVETLDDFSAAASSAAEFGAQVAAFNAILDSVADDLEALLITADETLVTIGSLSDGAATALEAGTETMVAAQSAIGAAEAYITEDLTAATADMRGSLTQLQAEIETLSTEAQGMIAVFTETGTTANARLTEAEATLAAADVAIADFIATLESFDETTEYFDTLMRESGAPLIEEAREALAATTDVINNIGRIAEVDLPLIVADIRTATTIATETIEVVAGDLTAASGDVAGLSEAAEGALLQVTETFANANTTLTAINSALSVGERALSAAEGAFEGADRLLNEEVDGIVAGLEASLDQLNGAIDAVSADLPEVTEGLRAAAGSAQAAFAEVQRIVQSSGGAITQFANGGLPAITSLASETRTLIRNLDRLTQQISRDPARFLLDQQTPEFRR